MNNWMNALARHYQAMRAAHPTDSLLIVFDIDGTILDDHYATLHLLRRADEHFGTNWFRNCTLERVRRHGEDLPGLLATCAVPTERRGEVLAFLDERRWSTETVFASHRPFRGVLEVIRWFQLQPGVHVALNTSRPESARLVTLRSLNRLGAEFRVRFSSEMLHMMAPAHDGDVSRAKRDGLNQFVDQGYRIVAIVDDELDNLHAMKTCSRARDALLLHAGLFGRTSRNRPARDAISGESYDVARLIRAHQLPKHVQLVWEDVNSPLNLQQFLTANVHWAECTVPHLGPYDELPRNLASTLERLAAARRGIRLVLPPTACIGTLSRALADLEIPDHRLWFSVRMDAIGGTGLRELRRLHANAIIDCALGPLVTLIKADPTRGREELEHLADCGVSRFSVDWKIPGKETVLDKLEHWGFAVHIDRIPSLEAFLHATLLLPDSAGTPFDFRTWHPARQPERAERLAAN